MPKNDSLEARANLVTDRPIHNLHYNAMPKLQKRHKISLIEEIRKKRETKPTCGRKQDCHLNHGVVMSLGIIGNLVEKLSDAIGLPEEVGDLLGGAAELLQGNIPGAIFHGLDLFCDVDPAKGLLDFSDQPQTSNPSAQNLVVDVARETVTAAIRV